MKYQDCIGRKFTFRCKEWESELFNELGIDLEGREGVILGIEWEHEEFESCYWDIKIDNVTYHAISGHHLQLNK